MADDKKILLKKALGKIILPLVRLMLSHGITYREFCDIGKEVFFAAGRDMMKSHNEKPTASQLTILTGVHRKDIAAFLQRENDLAHVPPAPKNLPAGAAVVAEWICNPSYLGKDGQPKALPYSAEHPEVSFSALVEGISTDIRPRAYLDELKRLGIIAADEKGLLRLQTEAFIPSQDFAEKLKMFERNLGAHLSAGAENMQKTPSPFFERSAFHGGLSPEGIAAIREIINNDGMDLLKKVYRQAEELSEEPGKSPEKSNRRMTIGLYMYDEETQNADKN